MRILLIGAGGLIGQAAGASLAQLGHVVIGAGSRFPTAGNPTERVYLDLRRMLTEEAWLPHLKHIDAVVNCAGVLQDSDRDSTAAVHAEAPKALFRACERAGVRRVIHISAIGVDRETPTAFSRRRRSPRSPPTTRFRAARHRRRYRLLHAAGPPDRQTGHRGSDCPHRRRWAFAVFSLFWIMTAFMSLGPGWDIGLGLMEEGGVTVPTSCSPQRPWWRSL